MEKEKSTQWLSYITAGLVFLLALGGFVLSFNALRAVALKNGQDVYLSYLWPLLIDLALVIFSIAIIRASLLGERTWWPWLLVGVFTFGTVVFNFVHASDNLTQFTAFGLTLKLKQLVGIIPPITLVLAFETLMLMSRSTFRRNWLVKTTDKLKGQYEQLVSQQRQLQGQLDRQKGQIEANKQTIAGLNSDIKVKREELERATDGAMRVYVPDNLTVNQRQSIVKQMVNDSWQLGAIAEALEVSLSTVKNDKKAFSGNGQG